MIQSWKGIVPVIHPDAYVHPAAVIIGDVVIGAHSSIWPCAVLRGDCAPIRIGACSNVQDGTIVHTTTGLSEVHIGDRVTIGHNAVIHGCRTGNDVLIGMHATVLDNAMLGDFTMVAAGSVVPVGRRHDEGGLLVGSPARLKGPLTEVHRGMIENGWTTYLAMARSFGGGDIQTIG